MPPILRVNGLTVSINNGIESFKVIDDLNLEINRNQTLAIVGESGSGKSMTALAVLRLMPDVAIVNSGSILLSDFDVLDSPEKVMQSIRGRRVSMVFQEPMTSLNPVMTVGRQLLEVIEKHTALRGDSARLKAIEWLGKVGLPSPEDKLKTFPFQLSGGQRQRVMIAMALAGEPELLIADEPTTALDVTIQAQILKLLKDLQKENGMAMLLITHDLNLAKGFADQVVVMQSGKVVERGDVVHVMDDPQHPYTQKLLSSRPVRMVKGSADGDLVLSANKLSVTYKLPKKGFLALFGSDRFLAVNKVGFNLKHGQTLAVVGESGSGKSTLAMAVLGLLPFEGDLGIQGRSWNENAGSNKSLRQIVQVVFQDPYSSLSPRMTVLELVSEGLRVHQPHMKLAQQIERVINTLQLVGMTELRFPGLLNRYAHEFSGGQRQRIAIARALVVEPQILILDEPTSALDVTIQKQVLELLVELQQTKGLSYLLITHDMDVVSALAHHVLVLKQGHVVEQGTFEAVFNQPQHQYTRELLANRPSEINFHD